MVATVHGAEGDRTPDLSVANAALSQLSYGPEELAALAAEINPARGLANETSHGRDRIRTCDLYDVNVAL